jgi:predicted aldo/keto reductase-like oxidoreductase
MGVAGASMLPASLKATDLQSGSELVTRDLGKTGLKVPVISLGAGGSNSPQFIKAVHEAGVKLFFSATYYGEGNNEKMLGDALKGIPRDSFLVGTAALPRGVDNANGVYTKESTYDSLIKTVENSLTRFGMDHMDILLLPFAAKRESVFFEPLLRAMEDLKKQGKTRFIGIASHSLADEALIAAADTKIYDLAMISYNFKEDNNRKLEDAIVYAGKAGLGILAMKTQAGSYWDKERKEPINSQSTLRWVLKNPYVSSVVSGMSQFEELQQNIALMKNLKYTEQDRKDLRLTLQADPAGLYCRQCLECVPQCPHHLDIPTLMRSYMYAYGYKNFGQAKAAMQKVDLSAKYCNLCESCQVQCTAGFDVQNKVRDIARLKEVPADFLMA